MERRRSPGRRGEVTCAAGANARPSNRSRGDAFHHSEATYVRKCLGSKAPGDLPCSPKCPAWKSQRDVPGLVVLTHSALLYNFSCGPQRQPLTLSQPASSARSPVSLSFKLIPSLSTGPRHIHHRTLASICCAACYCFSFSLGRSVFTNGLLPADQCFRLSCINYWSSRTDE